MKFSISESMLFALLRHALNAIPFPEGLFENASARDWDECHNLAVAQGVMAVSWDAVVALPTEMQPYKALKIKWGMAVENYELRYLKYCRSVAKLSEFYASHNIATVQLKGVGLSTYYPIPNHREGGDIDIYTYSADPEKLSDKEANTLADRLMQERGIEVDTKHSYKHSVFFFDGIPIENHKFFLNVEHYEGAAKAEKLLKKVFNPRKVTLGGDNDIMIPSPEFNSIFVSTHALQHFTSGLSLHQLCDWACTLKKHRDLQLVLSVQDEHFTNAVEALTQLCVRYLGSDMEAKSGFDELCDIIIAEVLHPGYKKGEMPSNPVSILWYKTKRFAYSTRLRAKVWNTSVLKAIWQSIVAHLKNPKTIFEGE